MDTDEKVVYDRVRERVLWWITDMRYKPPEVTTGSYFEGMADNIARCAANANAWDDE